MSRLMIAINVFLRVLRDPPFAERARRMLDEVTPPPSSTTPLPPTAMRQAAAAAPAAPAVPLRSDALALLSVLQREARLIDFLKEDIAPYADAQVGAAVRDVHRDAAAALDRLFALKPVLDQPEGSDVAIPGTVDSARLRLVGNLGNTPPARGRLQHAGWQATKVELPQFTGGADTAKIVAPAEIEV
jgi:hypothetical protein